MYTVKTFYFFACMVPSMMVFGCLQLQMDEINLRIHHGGTLMMHPEVRYIGYKVYEKNIDKDLVTC